MATKQGSYLLALPPELRIVIYEYAFAYVPNARVSFFDANPPDKKLLLTCKLIGREARGIHNTAYRQYWQSTHFTIDQESRNDNFQVNFREDDLQRIHKLSLLTSAYGIASSKYSTGLLRDVISDIYDEDKAPKEFDRQEDGVWCEMDQLRARPKIVSRLAFGLISDPESWRLSYEVVFESDREGRLIKGAMKPLSVKEVRIMAGI